MHCQSEILLLPSLLIDLIITLGDFIRLGSEREGGDCKEEPTWGIFSLEHLLFGRCVLLGDRIADI